MSAPSTILSHAIDSKNSLIRAIYFGEFLTASLIASGPCGPVYIVDAVRRNQITNGVVDLIDPKDGSAGAVRDREVSIRMIFSLLMRIFVTSVASHLNTFGKERGTRKTTHQRYFKMDVVIDEDTVAKTIKLRNARHARRQPCAQCRNLEDLAIG